MEPFIIMSDYVNVTKIQNGHFHQQYALMLVFEEKKFKMAAVG